MKRTDVRAQVQAHYRAERLAIMLEAPDVTETEALWIVDCAEEADVVRALDGQPVCSCGTHDWGQA